MILNLLIKADGETHSHHTGPSPLPHPDVEHIIKSPPEPTRVKSPEQILMRSPDPVNWTVPLDTGKTFTVTQNVREGMKHFDFMSYLKESHIK